MDEPEHPTWYSAARNRPGWFLVAAALLFHLAIARVGWNHSVNEGNGFRQAQTALVAEEIATQGFRLDYEIPVFGWRSRAPLEFPVYQAFVAVVHRILGLPLESAGRLVSLSFFYATLAPLYVLARRLGAARFTAELALVFTLLSPLYLYWSREMLIESTALFFAISFAALTGECLRRPRAWTLILLACSGALGGLTKITTFALAAPVVAVLFYEWYHRAGRVLTSRRQLGVALPPMAAGAIALVAALAWVHYSDGIKMQEPLTAHLTSHALQAWNYGTWAQRFDRQVWWNIAYRSFRQILGAVHRDGIVFTLVVQAGILTLLCFSRRRLGPLVLLGTFCLGPMVFFNLYEIHGYYWFANSIYYLLAMALLLGEWVHSSRPGLRTAVRVAAGALPVLMVSGYFRSLYLDQSIDPQPERLRVAAFIKAHVPADKLLLIFEDYSWNPQMSYHSGRRALMNNLSPPSLVPEFLSVLRQTPAADFGALVLFPDADWATAERLYEVGGMGFAEPPDEKDNGIRVYLRRPVQASAGGI